MQKLRIGLLIENLHRHGGLERRTSALANGLLAAGHEVHIYANEWDSEAAEGAHFHRVPMLKLDRATKVLGFAWLSSRLAAGNDLIHTQARVFRYDVATLGVGCHRAYLDAVGIDPARAPGRWFHKTHLYIERSMLAPERFAAGTRVIVNSNRCKAEFINYYGVPEDKISVVRNGVDREAFSAASLADSRPAARWELGIQPHETAVLFVGSGFRRKGLDTLIQAVGRIRGASSAGPNGLRLLIVGRGSRDAYAKLAHSVGIGERLIWIGQAQPKDVAKFYAAADVFVLPTRYDPFANSTLEALACGLPVITTDANGVSEILRNGVDSLIVKPDDAEALAEGLGAVVDDAEFRQHLGTNGLKTVEPYTWQKTTEQTLDVYETVIAHRSEA